MSRIESSASGLRWAKRWVSDRELSGFTEDELVLVGMAIDIDSELIRHKMAWVEQARDPHTRLLLLARKVVGRG